MLLMLALHGFSACNNYSEVKSFMTELSAAVSAHDTTAISKMFPEAWKADSLSLSFDIDDIHIEKLENGNYLVVLDDGRDITISKNETENSLSIIESHGVFAYPKDKIVFAQNTGWYDKALNDVQNAARLSDTLFITWMKDKVAEELKKLVKVSKTSIVKGEPRHMEGLGTTDEAIITYTVVVSNETDMDISGNDYSILAKITWVACENYTYINKVIREPESENKTLSGKPIPAKGTATYTWEEQDIIMAHIWNEDYAISCTLNYTPSMDTMMSAYHFTGKEHAEYLNAHNE